MENPGAKAVSETLKRARSAIDAGLSRDRGRLHGLWSRWRAAPGSEAARTRFEEALEASRAARGARAAALPDAPVEGSLPIAGEAGRIVGLIREHPVVVVAGETGSGKTTQLPKLCLQAGRGAAGTIGCTQPRRIAARAVARRVAEELRVPLGGVVGYQVRFSDRAGERTAIKFMTDGILLAEIGSDRWLSAYDTIIVDEAHERSLNIDFLLGYLKQLLEKRSDLRVIVTSATIDTARFAAHFRGAPVVSVEGRGYPVEVRYRPLGGEPGSEPRSPSPAAERRGSPGEDDSESLSLLDGIVAACDEIAREPGGGDTLVFLPGEREIRDAHRALEARRYRHTEVLPLYARLSARGQDRVFDPGPQRRIVLATNVAETSLTVPRIHYVVDPGVARVKRYSPRQKLDRLHVEPVSQASADQRKGRCGRIAPGICYRIYSEADFQARAPYTDPEIRRAALAGVILRMLALGLGEIERFPFVEPPDPRAVADGWQQLAELGAVDDQRRLTATGRSMARLPVDVKLARMLVAAREHGCLREMLAIAAFLGIQDPRERPAEQRAAADNAHALFADPKSEFVGILRLWDAYREAHEDSTQSQLRRWCDRHFLGFLRMREWRELHRQLKLQCEALGWAVAGLDEPLALADAEAGAGDPGDAKVAAGRPRRAGAAPQAPGKGRHPYATLHRALIAGLPTQIGQRGDRNLYEGPRGRRFQLFPGSALARKPPPWVLAATLLDTERVWALTNAAIEPDWVIAELGHLLARRHHDPRWSRAQGRVLGSEQVGLFGLVLAPKRPVDYGRLYPREARELFLRDGLVAGEINLRSPFLARNLATLERAREEEAKQRRAGLVVDEEWMAQWYDARIPAQIVDARTLDAWIAKAPESERRALEWSRDELLVGDESDAARFPPVLALGEARLAVRYRFEPGAPDDGMTVSVPLHLLNALDPVRLGWLAPGFFEEKATALIRSLPKVLRRNFVPVPDFARAFAEAHPQPQSDAFESALARFLQRLTGAAVAAADFEGAALEPHLRINLRLLAADGRQVLAETRDLDALRAQFGERAARAFAARAAEGMAREGLREFPEQPVPRSVPGVGGVAAYPALADAGDGASLAVHADPARADALHPGGVLRLLRIALETRLRQARKQLPVAPKTALLYAAIEAAAPRAPEPRGGDLLREDLVEGAFLALAAEGLGEVRDAGAFAARRDAVARALFAESTRRLRLAENILERVAAIRARLDSGLMGWARANLDDMRAQLSALAPPGFLRDVPEPLLAETPRYLQALELRAERALRDPLRDQQRMLELAPFVSALRQAEVEGESKAPQWRAFARDLEELRVSLYAQELGARGNVSAKKLARRLDALRGG
ncbi:ATP-dependent RNA helicase HrpA [Luteimonas sp. RD2P54]|uniref:ATP-dependent RNA helicase HrpA n=1 Tax=Luteimonas endophytica TaxID=3042023 RepID=A0ABT6J5W8_9GAMM|nr:ATP-dependent RNA helicase HrpA [Luteimonas endophytica]MDH5822220.1 ATP-dependent RNA helicase HrpA [Luteimonas endophytica]